MKSYSQVFVKGSFFKPPILGESLITWRSGGLEYKYKRMGIEYIYKYLTAEGDGFYKRKSNQVYIKYYFFNKPDSVSTYKFYVAPFVYQRTNEYESDYEGYVYKLYKGNGYGLLLGGKRKIYKHFGIESGIYWHYYNDKTYNYIDGHRVGFRLMVYFNS